MTITTGYRSWSDERKSRMQLLMLDALGVFCVFLCLVLIAAALLHGFATATVKTAQISSQSTYQQHTHYYDKPAAFRLSTPTQAQMDHLHAMLTVERVRKADGTVPDGVE